MTEDDDDTISFSILNLVSLISSLISAYGGTEGLLAGQSGIASGSILMMHCYSHLCTYKDQSCEVKNPQMTRSFVSR